jgi:hypothetical protein
MDALLCIGSLHRTLRACAPVCVSSLYTLLDVSGAGVVSLFSSLSATSRHSLQQLMLNVDLPPPLRKILWPVFLKHTDGREVRAEKRRKTGLYDGTHLSIYLR